MIGRDAWEYPRPQFFDDVCEHCGRSLLSRFGDEPVPACGSCEDDISRAEEAAFWGADAA